MPFAPLVEAPIDYAAEPLCFDGAFRSALLAQLVGVGAAIEAAFGGQPQDVEGVVVDGCVSVVQARPQVVDT